MRSACAGLLGVGVGSSAAQAFEVNEATSPLAVDGDFVDLGEGVVLPIGVTSIRGTVGLFPVTGDGDDLFQWMTLTPSQPFSIGAELAENHPFAVFAPTDATFEPAVGGLENEGTYRGITPDDGIVIFRVSEGEGGNTEGAYTLTLSVVPEPSTGAIAAMGAAALLGMAQRKRD